MFLCFLFSLGGTFLHLAKNRKIKEPLRKYCFLYCPLFSLRETFLQLAKNRKTKEPLRKYHFVSLLFIFLSEFFYLAKNRETKKPLRKYHFFSLPLTLLCVKFTYPTTKRIVSLTTTCKASGSSSEFHGCVRPNT